MFSSAFQTNPRRNSTKGHAHGKLPISIPNYNSINRRINRMNIDVEDTVTKESKYEYIIIAIDSTGIKITNTEVNG